MIPPVSEITRLHTDATASWHRSPISHPDSGIMNLVSRQHEQNFCLWHEEDKARSPAASDAEITAVKRNIDRFNQQRNDLIERLDDHITELLAKSGLCPTLDAAINTETAGSVIDRLSIMSLRIFHYDEQLAREDAGASHRVNVTRRLALCHEQCADLAASLQRLVDDLASGKLRHKTYRQLKMYNDPELNPAIYNAG